jgi:hypothetical protein
VRVVTALEDFCIGARAEYDRFAEFRHISIKREQRTEVEDEGISPMKLYAKLGWHTATLTIL